VITTPFCRPTTPILLASLVSLPDFVKAAKLILFVDVRGAAPRLFLQVLILLDFKS
jgi:hypothetical protein